MRIECENLFSAVADDAGEFSDNQVNTLQAGLLQTRDLLLDDGFESQIGREETDADTVNVADGEGNLAPQLLLVKLHLDDLEREAFVEEAVDFRTARQLHRVYVGRAGTFDGSLEVRLHQLDHSAQR